MRRYQRLLLRLNGAYSAFNFTALYASSCTFTLWFFDSGASHHMTFDKSILTNCSHIHNSLCIYTTNGTLFLVIQCSDITPSSNYSGHLTLFSIFHIAQLSMQLLSVGKITSTSCNILFTPTSCVIQDHTSWKIVTSHKVNGLFQLKYLHLPPASPVDLPPPSTVDFGVFALNTGIID